MRNILSSLKKVYKKPVYWVISIITALAVFLLSVYLPNLSLIKQIWFSSQADLGDKLSFMLSLVGAIYTNTTLFSASFIIALSLLFGANISMIIYVIRKNRRARDAGFSTSAAGGIISGFLGIGCAACGSLILTPVLASIGAVGFLTALPLRGEEFGLIGVVLMAYSIYALSKKISPKVVTVGESN